MGVILNMGYLATWSMVMLGAGVGLALDLSSIKNFPAGLDLRKIQNLMRVVDPKTCGCARPEQHCEVPVPEARFVGFTCKIGTFCCRMKKHPGRPNLKDFQRFLPAQPSQSPGRNNQPSQQFTRTRQPPRQVPNNKRNIIQNKENSWRKDTTANNQPIYNHNEIKTEETKEKADEIEPHHLGLPKGIKAFIKPVSQLQHRILAAPAEETNPKENEDKICKCEPTDNCPKEQRDYITFRKSCPFGQVQCCRNAGEIAEQDHISLDNLNAQETGLKGEIEILSTTSKAYPAQIQPQTSTPIASLSHIRPVHIPVPLVPTTTKQEESSPAPVHTPELTDQTVNIGTTTTATTTTTTTTILPTETTRTSPAVTTTPSSVTLLYSATPYTIISSSTSVSKIEWDYQPNKQQKKVFQVHNLPSRVQSTSTPTPPLTPVAVFSTRKPIFISPDRSQAVILPSGNKLQQRRPIQQTQRPQRIQPTIHQLRPHIQNRPTKTSSVPRSQAGPFQVVNPSRPVQHPQNRAHSPEHTRPRQHNVHPSQAINSGHPQINRPRPVNIRPQSQNIRPPSQNIRPQPQNSEQNIWRTVSNTEPQQFSNINQPRARPPTNPETLYPLQKNALPPRQPYQPPVRQIIDRADTQPRQMGFVESVGDAAIKMVEKLFSWPF